MSDATDAVAEAKARTKHLAATHLVRKQDLEAEIEKLRASGDPGAEARIAAATTELLTATQNYKDAMAELVNLDRLGAQALTVDARVIASQGSDPLIRTYEQIALDNVRQRGTDMDAMDRLNQELGQTPAGGVIEAAPEPPKKLSREEADAAARLEFEALRARRAAPAAPTADAPASTDETTTTTPKPPPKKTL